MTAGRFCVAGGWESTRDAEHGYWAARDLLGTLSVGAVLLLSAIDEVRSLAEGSPESDDALDTQGFVRPRMQGGRLVLTVQPGLHGYVPFEQPNPTPCCADHRPRAQG
jgi:hypothetical protein